MPKTLLASLLLCLNVLPPICTFAGPGITIEVDVFIEKPGGYPTPPGPVPGFPDVY